MPPSTLGHRCRPPKALLSFPSAFLPGPSLGNLGASSTEASEGPRLTFAPQRPLTWRAVVQFAVVGPPAGAGGLPNEERARHGGRAAGVSGWGNQRDAPREPKNAPARPCRSAVSWRRPANSFNYGSAKGRGGRRHALHAPEPIAAALRRRPRPEPTSAPIAARRRWRPRPRAGAPGAGGTRAAWRGEPGVGCSRCAPTRILRAQRGTGRGALPGAPRRRGTTPDAPIRPLARPAARLWRPLARACVRTPDFPKSPPPPGPGRGRRKFPALGWDGRGLPPHPPGEGAEMGTCTRVRQAEMHGRFAESVPSRKLPLANSYCVLRDGDFFWGVDGFVFVFFGCCF